ncbi:DUF4097 family beta strand repeat-containing protein [Arthrobacter zhaoguopingii]|uniref:DUF4097 family beta strand repeat-containing protein n=1 Tax=Arthrobacter zhaoguopingii TaxID=2681491 RepID=UPI00135C47E8|nr:DUF4097 family beta strand repeat-containing protein [Arthrobacter zhaoguopingii]
MGTLMTLFETSGPVGARIDIGARGDIWVGATDRAEVTVDVRPRNPSRSLDIDAAEQTTVEFVDGRLSVKLKQWRRHSWFSDGGAVVAAVEVPIGSSLEVSSGMGSLRVDGEFGDVSLSTGVGEIRVGTCAALRAKTGMGDITVLRATGPAELTSGTGRIDVDSLEGSGSIRNSNGETFVGEVTGDLQVKAANGDILIHRAGGNVNARASNGAVRIQEVHRGVITAHTSAGSIDIGVRPGTAVWLGLTTKFGQVRSGLDPADAPDDGHAAVQVRANSSYGDVTVHSSSDVGSGMP